MKRIKVVALLAITLLMIGSLTPAMAIEEGAYACRNESGAVNECWNFLKNFKCGSNYLYEQYYWAYPFEFTTSDTYYVDNMDVAFFSGHGSNYRITTYENWGGVVDFASGSVSLGDLDLETLTVDACSFSPADIDRADWADPWWDVFHRLHQILSFRTTGWYDGRVEDNYAKNLLAGQKYIDAWFNAANSVRSGMYPGYCSVVWASPQGSYPGAHNDTYYNTGGDPPYWLSRITITYQY